MNLVVGVVDFRDDACVDKAVMPYASVQPVGKVNLVAAAKKDALNAKLKDAASLPFDDRVEP